MRFLMNSIVAKTKVKLNEIGIIFITILFLIFTFFPIYYIFLTSIKPANLLFETPPRFIFKPTFETYNVLFLQEKYHIYYLNSLIVSGIATFLAIIFGSLGSFAFVRFKFSGSKILFFLVLLTRMYLPVTTSIPVFLAFKQIGLLDTRTALIIIYTATQLPLAIYILNSFFEAIPQEIKESAELDGCGPFNLYWRIVIPLATSGILAASILVFVFNWNEFLMALILTTVNAKTAPVALSAFSESEGMIHWAQLSALGFCMTIPTIFFMIFMNKYLIKGVLAGSIKG